MAEDKEKMAKAKPEKMMTSEEPNKKSSTKPAAKGEHKFARTIIHHHKNKTHTVEHHPHASADGKPGEAVTYAVPDMAGVHAGLDQNVGGGQEPNPSMGAAPAGTAAAGPAPTMV